MILKDWLCISITLLGAICVILSFILIFKGKRVGKEGKYVVKVLNKIEFSGNGILTLVMLSMLIFIAPLVIQTIQPEEFVFQINGVVETEKEEYLENVKLKLIVYDHKGDEKKNYKQLTDSHGSFDFTIKNIHKDDKIRLKIDSEQHNIHLTETILPVSNKRIIINQNPS